MAYSADFQNKEQTEVVIIGGSYSGMAAAMTLGRALRQITVIDAGQPCNRFARHAHNMLGSDGTPPHAIHALARKQVLQYPTVQLTEDRVTEVRRGPSGFTVYTRSGKCYQTTKVLLATGLKDELPAITGIEDCWGKSVIHCPYCHGYEFKGGKTGVLATGSGALHMISLLQQWTEDLQVFTDGNSPFDEAALRYIRRQGISLTTDKIISLVHNQGQVSQIRLQGSGGRTIDQPLDVLYVQPPVRQQLELHDRLGYRLTASGHIEVDEAGRTSVGGVYAAGDNASPLRSLSTAIAAGMTTGAMINFDLIQEKRPLPELR